MSEPLVTVIHCDEDGEAHLMTFEKQIFLDALNQGDFGSRPEFIIPEFGTIHLTEVAGLIVFDGVPVKPHPVTTATRYEL